MMKKKLLLLIAAKRGRLSFRSSDLFLEGSNFVGLLNVQRRGWSYAASVPSETDTLDAQKGRKRVSRHERRAMVEAFVTKYRVMNAGKFPTISLTKKQVGGGYYVIREIIQELKYKTKMNTETTKDKPSQDDYQSAVLDDKEAVNTVYEHLEEKSRPQTFSGEERLSKEAETISIPGDHCIAAESDPLEKCSEEPYLSSLQMPNDVKTDESVSGYSHSVAPESHLRHEEKERVSTPYSESYVTGHGKAQGHESKFVDMYNHQIMEEKCIVKAGYERRELASLEDMSKKPCYLSLQVPKDLKTGEDMSSYSSDSSAQEMHQLKEDIERVSAPFIEKSGSSCSEAQSHDSRFVDMENHSVIDQKSFDKSGHERKEQDSVQNLSGVDGPNHKMEQSQGPLELDDSKLDNSNNRESSNAVVSVKSTFWRSLKSFADGITSFWRK